VVRKARQHEIFKVVSRQEVLKAERKFQLWLKKELRTGKWDDSDVFRDAVED
jgi:hypothetical protein